MVLLLFHHKMANQTIDLLSPIPFSIYIEHNDIRRQCLTYHIRHNQRFDNRFDSNFCASKSTILRCDLIVMCSHDANKSKIQFHSYTAMRSVIDCWRDKILIDSRANDHKCRADANKSPNLLLLGRQKWLFDWIKSSIFVFFFTSFMIYLRRRRFGLRRKPKISLIPPGARVSGSAFLTS